MNNDMYSLLARYFTGQVTDAERQVVHSWAEASEENRKEMAFLREVWEKSGEDQHQSFDTEAAWQKIKAATSASAQQPAKLVLIRYRRLVVAAAAAVLLFFFVNRLFFSRTSYTTVTASENVQDIALEDGSHVYLRRGSQLRYPKSFAKNKREVRLTGEAFFDIARNPEKPFSIDAASTQVTVLGTSFTVHTSADTLVEVVVKTGLVKLALKADTLQQVKLSPGDKGIYRLNKISREANTDSNFDSWQTGRIVFSNTPLPQALQTLGRHYGVRFTIKKEEADKLAPTTLTSTFTNQPLEEVIRELEMITSFRIRAAGPGAWEISSR